MWNDTACTHPAHSWQSAVEWGTFQRQGELFRREKRRVVRCLHCRQIKRSKITEWESYGSQNFHGSLADSLPELVLPAARQLLRELYQAGNNKRWERWKLKSQACHPHFMDAVDELYRRGVMIKREQKDPARTVATRLLQVTHHPGHLPAIEQLLGVRHTTMPAWWAEVKPFPPTAASPLTGPGRHILAVLRQQQAMLDRGGPAVLVDAAGVVVTTSSYKKTYAKMIRALIELLGKAEAQGLQQLYIWPDLDPYGYQIALDVKERLARRGSGLRLYVFGFHREWLAHSAATAELSSVDREWIARLLQGPLPPSVRETLVDMQVAGRKAEQEMWVHEIGPKGFGARVEQESILL